MMGSAVSFLLGYDVTAAPRPGSPLYVKRQVQAYLLWSFMASE